MNRFKISLCVAVVGAVLEGIGFLLGMDSRIGMTMMTIGMPIGWIAYFFAGVTQAFKVAMGMYKFALHLPIFPLNLLVAMMMTIPVVYMVLLMPIIPVGITYAKNREQ